MEFQVIYTGVDKRHNLAELWEEVHVGTKCLLQALGESASGDRDKDLIEGLATECRKDVGGMVLVLIHGVVQTGGVNDVER